MHPNHPLAVWLTSSGIDPAMGGIASVTRSCLAALTTGASTPGTDSLRLSRFLGLRSRGFSGEADLHPDTSFLACRGSRLRFLLGNGRQVFSRPSWVLHEHVDLAQCQVLLPKALRSRCAVWCHGIELWRELPSRKEQALREADLLLFNSAFTRRKAATFHPWILDCPFRVVPLCREPSPVVDDSEPPPDPGSREPSILTVGRLVEDRPKGHLEILSALPRLVREIPDLHWHIVGDGPWRTEWERLVEESPVRDRITVHGFVDAATLDRLYRSSRVFAMPSRGEGFGLVYAEAMARGLPCIGSTLDAAAEVIREDGGVCIDPDSPGALEGAIARFLSEDEESFRARSRRARARAGYFSLERFGKDLRAALRDG